MKQQNLGVTGGIGVGLLMILCPLVYRYPVEWDLTVASKVALANKGLRHWHVSFSGLYATLKGPKNEAALARAIVSKVPGVVRVTVIETTDAEEVALLPPDGQPLYPKAHPDLTGSSARESLGLKTGFVQVYLHEGKIYVRGLYSDARLRDSILDSARQTFAGMPVLNESVLLSKQEMGWPKEVSQILPLLGTVHDLELSAGGDALILGGKVLYPQEREALVALVKGYLPLGVTLENNVRLVGQSFKPKPLPPPSGLGGTQRRQEQAKLDKVARAENIVFSSGSSRLPENAYDYLDRIVVVLRRDVKAAVMIGGYIDGQADSEANRLLSQKRAEVVRAYLIARGISINRLFAKGYAAGHPIASKGNRRITFDIL